MPNKALKKDARENRAPLSAGVRAIRPGPFTAALTHSLGIWTVRVW